MPSALAARATPPGAAPDELSRRFHALSDPTRIAILEHLRRGECCVCELSELLDASQSRLSFHLKTLRDAGLVIDRREGRWVHYTMVPEAVATLRDALDMLATPGRSRGRSWWACRR